MFWCFRKLHVFDPGDTAPVQSDLAWLTQDTGDHFSAVFWSCLLITQIMRGVVPMVSNAGWKSLIWILIIVDSIAGWGTVHICFNWQARGVVNSNMRINQNQCSNSEQIVPVEPEVRLSDWTQQTHLENIVRLWLVWTHQEGWCLLSQTCTAENLCRLSGACSDSSWSSRLRIGVKIYRDWDFGVIIKVILVKWD